MYPERMRLCIRPPNNLERVARQTNLARRLSACAVSASSFASSSHTCSRSEAGVGHHLRRCGMALAEAEALPSLSGVKERESSSKATLALLACTSCPDVVVGVWVASRLGNWAVRLPVKAYVSNQSILTRLTAIILSLSSTCPVVR